MEIHQILFANNPADLLSIEKTFILQHPDYTVCFKRYFLSSRAQLSELKSADGVASFVIQPVLGEYSIALWLFLVKDCPVELIWSTNLCSHAKDSALQTREILESYESYLTLKGLRIADNCVRTWFYVDDIDNNYHGVVVGRRENFELQGMTSGSHYLASTGICGGAVEPGTTVQMDALAIKGDFSQHYLYAPDTFCLTHDYGVTFERGVVLDYGGESHILISGTASIDNKGEIVHPGDVSAQTDRMLKNVEALYSEAGCTWNDTKMAIVYLRHAEDYATVYPILTQRLGNSIPMVITHAPVCRPGWLIEMECIAVKDQSSS